MMVKGNEKKIVGYLSRNPEGYNMNQLARKLGISVGSVHKILKKLEVAGFVIVRPMGNAKYYYLNLVNPEVFKLAELLLLEEKRLLKDFAKVYANDLEGFRGAKGIILFGSILNKKEFNDVDVLFLDSSATEVEKFISEIEKVRSKPLSPFILTKKDLIAGLKEGKNSLQEIMKKGVVLKGEKLFLEVIKNVYGK
jgi:DNA-binding MarR family transcriptional regulator